MDSRLNYEKERIEFELEEKRKEELAKKYFGKYWDRMPSIFGRVLVVPKLR